jgi:hypothetical protein
MLRIGVLVVRKGVRKNAYCSPQWGEANFLFANLRSISPAYEARPCATSGVQRTDPPIQTATANKSLTALAAIPISALFPFVVKGRQPVAPADGTGTVPAGGGSPSPLPGGSGQNARPALRPVRSPTLILPRKRGRTMEGALHWMTAGSG